MLFQLLFSATSAFLFVSIFFNLGITVNNIPSLMPLLAVMMVLAIVINLGFYLESTKNSGVLLSLLIFIFFTVVTFIVICLTSIVLIFACIILVGQWFYIAMTVTLLVTYLQITTTVATLYREDKRLYN
tara:strand:+ start:177 stop:563 length:387 start_codon:yes stop_codon:yes gene_type:complete